MPYVRNPVVDWLLSHSYGQRGTVAVPASAPTDPAWPKGEFPPGIGDTLDYLEARYASWTSTSRELDWCILVGGPGNGKSEALRDLARRLGIQLPPRAVGTPVPRVVPRDWPASTHTLGTGLNIALINDASIPRAGHDSGTGEGSLFLDFADALEKTSAGNHTVLFGNVNRGVLVEELGLLARAGIVPGDGPKGRAAGIIKWLATPPVLSGADVPTPPAGIETTKSLEPAAPHYGQFRLEIAGGESPWRIFVHVLFLDVLSLLEPKPGVGGSTVDFSVNPPDVPRYQVLGGLGSEAPGRDLTIAGQLLGLYALPARWQEGGCLDQATGQKCAAFEICPFAQNSLWLQSDVLRRRFLDTLRAAEIAAGRRLTYRDLLGHISLAMIGRPHKSWLGGKHPCQWVEERHGEMETGSKGAVADLISRRVYSNLFPGAGFPVERRLAEARLAGDTIFGSLLTQLLDGGEPARVPAYERAFTEVDPCRDTDAWGGLRKKTLDVVESIDITLPTSKLSGWSEIPPGVISELESVLDGLLQGELAAEHPEGSRRSVARVKLMRKWRASQLLRQVGLALGRLRFAPALEAWLIEQERALQNGERGKLGDGLNNLIIPPAGSGKVYLAPLRPRTYCLSGELPENTVLVNIPVNDLEVTVIPHGDTLTAVVSMKRRLEAPEQLASLTIDLAVAREALLHAETKSDSFTEIGDTAFARIERARASLVGNARLRRITASFSDTGGKVYQISVNPGANPPLRVQRV